MGKKTEFLYLNEQETIDAGVLDAGACVDNAQDVFEILGRGDYLMGGSLHNSHGIGLIFPKESKFPNMPLAGPDRRFFSMMAYVGGRFDVCGDKWYGSNAANKEKGLPRSILTVVLNDKDTGEPLSLMAANLISAARTGAVSGVGARHLAREDSSVCAVIGCGPINRSCFRSIYSQRKGIRKVICNDIVEEKALAFAEYIRNDFGIEAVTSFDYEETVRDADIISVAASRIKPVYIKKEWAKEGAAFLITGPVQADYEFWTETKIVLDHVELHKNYVAEAVASGDKAGYYAGVIGGPMYTLIDEGNLPELEDFAGMGPVLLGEAEGRKDDKEIVVFVACGMAVFDVGLSYDIYKNALSKGIGKRLTLWDEPSQA